MKPTRIDMKTKACYWILKLFAIGFVLIQNGCRKENPVPTNPDYSQSTRWLSIPPTVYPVDVFYLYPTAWTSSDSSSQISAIDEPSMLIQAPLAFARQATAFNTVANIYAPFYRQDNSSPFNRWNVIAGIPTSDAMAAFDYYIRHFNNGRPFILAGHSQGATVLTNLLAIYMKNNPQVYANMVAAYVIGSPITQAYLDENKHLKFAAGPDDTGVIISWNTEAPNVLGINPVLYGKVGIAINPINWKRDQTLATVAEGLGSLFPLPPTFAFVVVPQCADAQVDITKGVLISNVFPSFLPILNKIDSAQGFPSGIYHTFDIPFYYFNIQKNAATRITKFLKR